MEMYKNGQFGLHVVWKLLENVTKNYTSVVQWCCTHNQFQHCQNHFIFWTLLLWSRLTEGFLNCTVFQWLCQALSWLWCLCREVLLCGMSLVLWGQKLLSHECSSSVFFKYFSSFFPSRSEWTVWMK